MFLSIKDLEHFGIKTMLFDTEEEKKVYQDILMLVKTINSRLLQYDKRVGRILDELTGAGMLAGAIAYKKSYDPNHKSKAKFTTFAYYQIKGAIMNELRKQEKHYNQFYLDEVKFSVKDKLDGDSPEDVFNDRKSCSATDAIVPIDLDRYEKFVITWETNGETRAKMRQKLKNLRSTRTLEEIEESIKDKIREANINNK